ncbi:RPS6KA4 isoform 5 [Pongo abelii]|uniref:RPS6KA4 isoform 5 n=1 Tax=Pongo abelii TaxID=9601 RepID=A0A2J8TYP8_PONAB|nr:RPS6KA4 isoform 5 [Pongo abelii]
MGDEDEDESCAVELRITEANLTGHEEKPTAKCSWCGRRAGTTRGSCTP